MSVMDAVKILLVMCSSGIAVMVIAFIWILLR